MISPEDANAYLAKLTPQERHALAEKSVMTDEEFNAALDAQFGFITDHFKQADELYLMIICYCIERDSGERQSVLISIPEGWPDGLDKEKIQMGIGAKLYEDGWEPRAIFAISEAWAVSRKNEPYDGPPPSEAPDKFEIAFAIGKTIDGRDNQASWKIGRTKEGRPKLEPWQYQPYTFEPKDPEKEMRLENYMADAIFNGFAMKKMAVEGTNGK
jgi:hypothetical protein